MFIEKYAKLFVVSLLILCVAAYLFFRFTFVPESSTDEKPIEKSQGGHWHDGVWHDSAH